MSLSLSEQRVKSVKEKKMRSTLIRVPPVKLISPHKVVRPQQVNELAADMNKRGWVGAPLIGYWVGSTPDSEPCIQLLSGTHRHAAATRVGHWVPVRVYPHSLMTRCWGRLARWAALMRGDL